MLGWVWIDPLGSAMYLLVTGWPALDMEKGAIIIEAGNQLSDLT